MRRERGGEGPGRGEAFGAAYLSLGFASTLIKGLPCTSEHVKAYGAGELSEDLSQIWIYWVCYGA